MKKSLTIGIVAIIVIWGAYLGYAKMTKEKNVDTSELNVTKVERGDISVKVTGSGVIDAKYREEIKVSNAGTVKEVLFEEGDKVKEGDELVDFSGYVDSLEAPISGTIINAETPSSGTMVKSAVKEDDLLTPGQVVAQVVNYDKLQLKIEVDELDISKVKVGQSAEVSVAAFPEETFAGKVIEIAKEGVINNGVATFNVTIDINEPKELRVGMTADATILVEEKEQVLLVPVEGIQSKEGKYFAMVKETSATEESKAEKGALKPIKVGIHNEDYIEIVSGLSEGEEIVLPDLGSADKENSGFPGMRSGGGMRPGGSDRDEAGARGDAQ